MKKLLFAAILAALPLTSAHAGQPTPLTMGIDRSGGPSASWPVCANRLTSGACAQMGSVSPSNVWTPLGPAGLPFATSATTDTTNPANILFQNPAAGAVGTTAYAKLHALETSALEFGITCDGVTDYTTKINQALASLAYTGSPFGAATLRFAGGTCPISGTIGGTAGGGKYSDIAIVGNGAAEGGRIGTKFKWIGGAAGRMVDLTSSGDGYFTSASRFEGIELDANNTAATCFYARTFTRSQWDIMCDNPAVTTPGVGGVDLDVANTAQAGQYNSSVGNVISIKVTGAADAGAAITLTGGSPNFTLAAANPAIVPGMYVYAAGTAIGAQVQSISGTAGVMTKNATFTPSAGLGAYFTKYGGQYVLLGRGLGVGHNTGDINSSYFPKIIVVSPGPDAVTLGAMDANIFGYIEAVGPPGSGTTGGNGFVGLRLQGSTLSAASTATPPNPSSTNAAPDPIGSEAFRWNTILMTQLNGRLVIENGAAIAATPTSNTYPASNNDIRGLGTGDSFALLDNTNAAGTSSNATGNGVTNNLNIIGTDQRTVQGMILKGVNIYPQDGFTGDAPTSNCGAIQAGGSNNAFVSSITAASTSCTITFSASATIKSAPVCVATAYGTGAAPIGVSQSYTGSKASALFNFASSIPAGGALFAHCF